MFSKEELKAMLKESGKTSSDLVREFDDIVAAAEKELDAEEKARKEDEKYKYALAQCGQEVIERVADFLDCAGEKDLLDKINKNLPESPEELISMIHLFVFMLETVDAINHTLDIFSEDDKDSFESLSNMLKNFLFNM